MWRAMAAKIRRLRLLLFIALLGVKSAYEYRTAFWLQVGGMVLNNSAIVALMALFYTQFPSVNGWRLQDTLLVYGMVAIAFGCFQLLFANVARGSLGERIVEGGLDQYMTFPQPTLFHMSIRRIDISGLGDVLSGAAYVTMSGYLSSWDAFLLLPVAIGLAVSIFYSSSILVQSLAFWLSGARGLGVIYSGINVMIANWPQPVFTGAARVVFLGLFAAFFSAFLPAKLITDFTWPAALGLLLFAICFNVLARLVFTLGLRRYESGNLVTTNL